MPASVRYYEENTEFSGKITREKYERIRAAFPFMGFNTYVINKIVDELLAAYEKDPTVAAVIATGVERMMKEGRT